MFTDYLSEGLEFELDTHNIDVTTWRVGGVGSILADSEEFTGFTDESAAEYVNQALNKVTSGVHYGHWKDDFAALMLENLSWLMPNVKHFYMKNVVESLFKAKNKYSPEKKK